MSRLDAIYGYSLMRSEMSVYIRPWTRWERLCVRAEDLYWGPLYYLLNYLLIVVLCAALMKSV